MPTGLTLVSMRDAIAWSYELLDEAEKKLFRSLSVFVGGFTFESAEVICDSEDIFEGISSLVDKSLVQKREQANGEPRFYMLMTIKEFGLEQLALESEENFIRSQHLLYFLSLAEEHCANLRGTKAAVSVDILEDEHNNLRLALDFALENDLEKAMLLAKSLSGRRATTVVVDRLRRALIPLWVFGAVVALFWGERLLDAYLRLF